MLTPSLSLCQEKCHQYWPAERSARYQYFVVDPMAEYNMPQYILREFKVTDARVRHKPLHSCFLQQFQERTHCNSHVRMFRTANRGPSGSSSSPIGRSKVCRNQVKASSTSSAKCIKRKSSSVRTDPSQSTAGKTFPMGDILRGHRDPDL